MGPNSPLFFEDLPYSLILPNPPHIFSRFSNICGLDAIKLGSSCETMLIEIV